MTELKYLESKGIKDNPRIIDSSGQATDFYLQDLLEDYTKQLTLTDVVVPKGTLCCPECKSTDLKVAIHTDYNECNKCYHYWET